jgi:hypothetical protein
MNATRLVCLSFLLLAGCAARQAEPAYAPSAEAVGYAQRYPEQITAETEAAVADEARAQELIASFSKRGPELKEAPSPELVVSIIDASDEAGRTRDFRDAQSEARVVQRFFDAERGTVSSRASSAAEQKMVEGKCEKIEVGGVIAYALKDGVEKQLEKRLRARNDAHVLIERAKGKLTPQSTARLQQLADDVALASYLVHVALVEEQTRLERLVSDRRTVKSTQQDALEGERAYAAEPGHTDAEKRASRVRLEALEKSSAAIDNAANKAEKQLDGLRERVAKAQQDYENAKQGLKVEIEQTPDSPQEGGLTAR